MDGENGEDGHPGLHALKIAEKEARKGGESVRLVDVEETRMYREAVPERNVYHNQNLFQVSMIILKHQHRH